MYSFTYPNIVNNKLTKCKNRPGSPFSHVKFLFNNCRYRFWLSVWKGFVIFYTKHVIIVTVEFNFVHAIETHRLWLRPHSKRKILLFFFYYAHNATCWAGCEHVSKTNLLRKPKCPFPRSIYIHIIEWSVWLFSSIPIVAYFVIFHFLCIQELGTSLDQYLGRGQGFQINFVWFNLVIMSHSYCIL